MAKSTPNKSPAPAQAAKVPRKQSASKGHGRQQQQQQGGQDGLVPIVCGAQSALFDPAAFKVQLDDGSWVRPSAFERLGGKEASKKWKVSLYVMTADGGRVQIGRWLEQQGIEGPAPLQRKQAPSKKRKRQQQDEENEGEEQQQQQQQQQEGGKEEEQEEEEEIQPQQKKRKVGRPRKDAAGPASAEAASDDEGDEADEAAAAPPAKKQKVSRQQQHQPPQQQQQARRLTPTGKQANMPQQPGGTKQPKQQEAKQQQQPPKQGKAKALQAADGAKKRNIQQQQAERAPGRAGKQTGRSPVAAAAAGGGGGGRARIGEVVAAAEAAAAATAKREEKRRQRQQQGEEQGGTQRLDMLAEAAAHERVQHLTQIQSEVLQQQGQQPLQAQLQQQMMQRQQQQQGAQQQQQGQQPLQAEQQQQQQGAHQQQQQGAQPANALERLGRQEVAYDMELLGLIGDLAKAEAAQVRALGSQEQGALWTLQRVQQMRQQLQQPLLQPPPPQQQQQAQPQQQQQQQPLSDAVQRRMVQMAQAVAAGLGASNKDQLLHRLKYVLQRVPTVPKHLQGELQYCSHCRQDLEDTLLVYFLFGADGSLKHKLCRSCFIAAFNSWMNQQATQHGSWKEAHKSCLSHLNKQQARQINSWLEAAIADYEVAAKDRAGSSGSSGGGCSGSNGGSGRKPFVLPSAAHARMLEGRGMSEGRDWPVEYCSLREAKATLEALIGVVQRLPSFKIPPYSKLCQDPPCVVDQTMPLDKHGRLSLSPDALKALLCRMQPRQLSEAVKAKPGTQPADIIATMMQAVGIKQQQGRGGGRASAAAAAAAGSSSGGGGGNSSVHTERPYYNFNPIDLPGLEVQQQQQQQQQQQGGAGTSGGGGGSNGGSSGVSGASLSEADAAVSQLLGGFSRSSVSPSEYNAATWKVVKKHVKKLNKAAKRAKKAGKSGNAAACRFLAAVLNIRFSAASGDVAVQDLLTQVLLLLGGEGSGTRGHIDPAAALTYAYGIILPGKPLTPTTVLAVWLFVSPQVFTQVPLLRQLLWCVQHLLLEREVAAAQQQLDAARAAAPGSSAGTSRSGRLPAAVREATEALAAAQEALQEHDALWQQHKQRWEQEQGAQAAGQSSQAAAAAGRSSQAAAAAAGEPSQAAAAAVCDDALTEEEEGWLTSLFTHSFLTAEEMQQVQAALGDRYAVLLQQRGGQGVSVPIGWMHWVFNLKPCIKIAWEVARVQQLAAAAVMHRRLRCKSAEQPLDYLCLVPSAVRELVAWSRSL